jgi:hypothetical protein
MKKKMMYALLAVIVYLQSFSTFASNYVSSDPNKNSGYNRTNALDYALDWYGQRNTSEYYDAGSDCTNFVSQCLEKGGMGRISISSYSDINGWRPYSGTWENAHYFRKHWGHVHESSTVGLNRAYSYKVYTVDSALANFSTIYNTLWEGDIIQHAYSDGDTYHSQFVCGFPSYGGYIDITVAQHSSDILRSLKDHLESKQEDGFGSDYVFVYQIKNGY